MTKIITFASMHRIGLAGQLTEQALAFERCGRGRFLFVTGEKEQYPGLFQRLDEGGAPYAVIMGLDEHAEFPRLVREFAALVKGFGPDFVTVHSNWQLAIAVATKHLLRMSYEIVYTMHGYRNNYRIRSIVARCLIGMALLLFADRSITTSSFLRNRFSFLGHGNVLIFIGEDDALFENYPLPDFTDKKRLVFGGEFRTGKNQELLIRAFSRYVRLAGDADAELYLPGSGERLPRCRRLARELGIENRVFFPGFLDRRAMLDLYLHCQFAVVPSNIETFGRCIVEPFILGRVVLTRHVGIADDIIRHGETGFFFEGESDLTDLFHKVLPDRGLCEQISAAARSRRDQFRWDKICRDHFDLIYHARGAPKMHGGV